MTANATMIRDAICAWRRPKTISMSRRKKLSQKRPMA